MACPDLLLNVLVFVALLVLFLAQAAILGLVHLPFHVVDAPVPHFLANLLVFWFVVLGWYRLPFFVLLLQSLVCVVLAILMVVPLILTCIGSLVSLVWSLALILVELAGQLGRQFEILKLFELSFKGHNFLLIGRLGAPLSTVHE